MDPSLAEAVIAAAATVVAATLGLLAHRKSSREETSGETEAGSKSNAPPEGEAGDVVATTEPIRGTDRPTSFKEYRITIRSQCREDLERLGLTESQLLDMISSEFAGHLNYFLYDLEDYVMPVRSSILVYMDKVNDQLELKRTLTCTRDEAKLASWTDILALYRRAARLGYRTDPDQLVLLPSMYGTAERIHGELRKRIGKHYRLYDELDGLDPSIALLAFQIAEDEETSVLDPELVGRGGARSPEAAEIAFHVRQSMAAWEEARDIHRDQEAAVVAERQVIGALVACVERSLQHIHKILLGFPPVA